MRRALSLIINRQQIIEIACEGTSVASKTIFVEYPDVTLPSTPSGICGLLQEIIYPSPEP